jgi:hypothetical protein
MACGHAETSSTESKCSSSNSKVVRKFLCIWTGYGYALVLWQIKVRVQIVWLRPLVLVAIISRTHVRVLTPLGMCRAGPAKPTRQSCCSPTQTTLWVVGKGRSGSGKDSGVLELKMPNEVEAGKFKEEH